MRVVSDDALTVGKSAAVRNIVSRLRYYAMPPEQFSMAEDPSTASGRKSWRDVMTMLNRFEYNVDSHMSASEALRNALLYFNEIPDFTDGVDDSAYYSLQSLVAQIAGRMPEKVRVQENLFISAFQDLVAEYCSKYDPDIHSFLRWWDTSGATSIVGSPPDRNAVRVMTIHKSKGLEFKCVHVPDASWSFTGKSSLEWFDTSCLKEIFPIELPPIYPLELSQWMDSTPLSAQYRTRISDKRMDEFNVLYVTLTRAIDELIISYPSTGKGDKGIVTTGDFLDMVPGMLDAAGVEYSMTGQPARMLRSETTGLPA